MEKTSASTRLKKAAYSVAETAALCGISRARFYDHVASGVMPPPVYSTRTRRPFYLADTAALCVRIRETNIGFDGEYVLFYERRPQPAPAVSEPSLTSRKNVPADPLLIEMMEALRTMNVQAAEEEKLSAIHRQCPQGVTEMTFETDLRAIFNALKCRNADRTAC